LCPKNIYSFWIINKTQLLIKYFFGARGVKFLEKRRENVQILQEHRWRFDVWEAIFAVKNDGKYIINNWGLMKKNYFGWSGVYFIFMLYNCYVPTYHRFLRQILLLKHQNVIYYMAPYLMNHYLRKYLIKIRCVLFYRRHHIFYVKTRFQQNRYVFDVIVALVIFEHFLVVFQEI
jgi:hypothetical protein